MMTYTWGVKRTETLREVSKDYLAKIGDYMQYKADNAHTRTVWIDPAVLEREIALIIADKIKDEGHEPIYLEVEVYNWYVSFEYGLVYHYYLTWQLKILKASPIPWAWIIAAIVVAIAVYIFATASEKVWKILVEAGEALAAALGIPKEAGVTMILVSIVAIAVLVVFGVMTLVRR